MLRSMTGYGKSTLEDEEANIEVEIRSVNGRSFKFSSKLSPELIPYENEIKKLITDRISRGTISISVIYTPLGPKQPESINFTLLKEYYRRLADMAQELGIPPPSIDSILTLPGVVNPEEHLEVEPSRLELVKECFVRAMNEMLSMREEEGKQLTGSLESYIDSINNYLVQIEGLIPNIVREYKEKLKEKLKLLFADEQMELKEEDILREIVLFAERSDISEEVSRLKSHLAQFLQTIQKNGAGKTLEFLAQEMLREANTITSKANNATCCSLAIQIKSDVEKIKEQLQNIE